TAARRAPGCTLFPYTTLFRSVRDRERLQGRRPRGREEEPEPSGGAAEGQEDRPADRDAFHPLICLLFASCASIRYVDDPWHERRSEEHTSELQSRFDLVCRLL